MSTKWIALIATLVAVAVVCGCAGYFHYHPVTTTEQVRAREAGEKLFSGEGIAEPLAPGISGVPVSEELMIKEEGLIK